MRCPKGRFVCSQTPTPHAKDTSELRVVVCFIAFSAILVSGCVDLTPPWELPRPAGAGGTAGAFDSGGGVTAIDGGSNETGGLVAVDATGEAGGNGVGEVAGRADQPMGGEEAGSGSDGDAAIVGNHDGNHDGNYDGNHDVGVGSAGGAGGHGEVGKGAGGSGAGGKETDAAGTSTGDTMGSDGLAATGGAQTTGGNGATGGSTGTGGLIATGGALATGGVAATGGMLARGGAPSTGGANGTGGSSSVACSGVLYSGICWYLAASGSNCTQACAEHGGPSSLAAGHVGTAAQGGSLTECATILSLLGVGGTVQNVTSISGLGCSKSTGTMGHGPGLYWCTSPAFSATASLSGVLPACGCLQ